MNIQKRYAKQKGIKTKNNSNSAIDNYINSRLKTKELILNKKQKAEQKKELKKQIEEEIGNTMKDIIKSIKS